MLCYVIWHSTVQCCMLLRTAFCSSLWLFTYCKVHPQLWCRNCCFLLLFIVWSLLELCASKCTLVPVSILGWMWMGRIQPVEWAGSDQTLKPQAFLLFFSFLAFISSVFAFQHVSVRTSSRPVHIRGTEHQDGDQNQLQVSDTGMDRKRRLPWQLSGIHPATDLLIFGFFKL